jgi:hypothetical protein
MRIRNYAVVTTMTVSAVLTMIATQHCVPPSVAPIMVAIAQHESGLDPHAVHRNPNGTYDVGISQVNSSNFGWLGLDMRTAMDPCRNLAAGAKVLLVRYNGVPPPEIASAYAADVATKISDLTSTDTTSASTPDLKAPPAWDVWATEEYEEQKSKSAAPGGDVHPDAAANSEAPPAATDGPQPKKGKTNDAP